MFTQVNIGLYTCRGEESRYRLTFGTIENDSLMPWAGWRLYCIEQGVSSKIAEFVTNAQGISKESIRDYCSQHPQTENFIDTTMHEILARAADMMKYYEYANKVETTL